MTKVKHETILDQSLQDVVQITAAVLQSCAFYRVPVVFPMSLVRSSILNVVVAMAVFPESEQVFWGHFANRQDVCHDECCIFPKILFGKLNDFATSDEIVGCPDISFVGCSLIGTGVVVNQLCLHKHREAVSNLAKRKSTLLCKLGCFQTAIGGERREDVLREEESVVVRRRNISRLTAKKAPNVSSTSRVHSSVRYCASSVLYTKFLKDTVIT